MLEWEMTDEVKQILRTSQPTDVLYLSDKLLHKLSRYWQSPEALAKDDIYCDVPADIVWANTIPIKCMEIVFTDKDYPDYDRKVQEAFHSESVKFVHFHQPDPDDLNTYVCFTAVIRMSDETEIAIPFGIINDPGLDTYGNSLASVPMIGIVKYGSTSLKNYIKEHGMGILAQYLDSIASLIPVWYGIQVGLLNPTIKEVFKEHTDPKFPIVETKKDRKGKAKTKIRYVKKVTITDEMFEECVKRSYIHKKMCWYVTGHWRNQATKTGHKRIFIQGYWKGIARESKTVEEPREREMVLEPKDGMYLPNF